MSAAMATIDQHRALLHGSDVKAKSHCFVMNLTDKVNCLNIRSVLNQ